MKKVSLIIQIWVFVLVLVFSGCTTNNLVQVHFVSLTDSIVVTPNPIQHLSVKPSSQVSDKAIVLTVHTDQIICKNLTGIGGAFNEQGGEAFMRLPQAQRDELATALFNLENGSGFSFCRTAIGSSDFGLGAYSYSEVAEDYEMKHFSIERDKKSVIPFMQAALKQNPDLTFFASPWSPPGWMKKTGIMDAGDKDKVNNVLIQSPEIYKAYGLYFAKYFKAYAAEGVKLQRLLVQNEPDISTSYPSCNMSPEQMLELSFDYIQPAFDKAGVDAEIWAGTFRGHRKDAINFIALPGADNIGGIGVQYAPAKQIVEVVENDYKVMHTEGICHRAKNNFKEARSRFREVAGYMNAGTENFCYWNIALNEESTSGWDWPQNSLVRIDRDAGKVIYNPDFLPMSLMGKYIRPGDKSLKVDSSQDAMAIQNDKGITVFVQNDEANSVTAEINVGKQKVVVELPASSLCAVDVVLDEVK
jgi:glucosylceramidase